VHFVLRPRDDSFYVLFVEAAQKLVSGTALLRSSPSPAAR